MTWGPPFVFAHDNNFVSVTSNSNPVNFSEALAFAFRRKDIVFEMCGRGYEKRESPRQLRIERMGRVPFVPMHALQQIRHEEVCAGTVDDTLFLLEHEPVITLGKNHGREHLNVDPTELRHRGIDLCQTERGGDITYHGPGQVVGYPILRLTGHEQNVAAYVHRLEEILICVARDFGVEAGRKEGLRGIWSGDKKLGAVGVRVASWTTFHGFALNVKGPLRGFGLIVPCGLHGVDSTSLQDLSSVACDVAAVMDRMTVHACRVLERTARAVAPTPLPPHPPRSTPQEPPRSQL